MNGKGVFLVLVFLIVFLFENIFPFQEKNISWKKKHLIRNLFFALGSVLVALFFAPRLQNVSAVIHTYQLGIINHFYLNQSLRIILIIILFDVWMYFWHRINHEFPFLWRFHRMHHTDPLMDASTAFRFHPLEIILSNVFNVLAFVILGLSYQEFLIYNAFLYPVIIFHHSNITFPESFDRILRMVIVTPHMHKLHHSEIVSDTNSNYGSIFSMWDCIFNSFNLRDKLGEIVYGIGTFKGEKSQSIRGMLTIPFRR